MALCFNDFKMAFYLQMNQAETPFGWEMSLSNLLGELDPLKLSERRLYLWPMVMDSMEPGQVCKRTHSYSPHYNILFFFASGPIGFFWIFPLKKPTSWILPFSKREEVSPRGRAKGESGGMKIWKIIPSTATHFLEIFGKINAAAAAPYLPCCAY